MRIAIVGYGSLIWDLENLAPFVKGEWLIALGPLLPVEFSRVSPKRQQALVLNIDDQLGHDCKTSVIESSRNDINQAVDDLATRERCKADMIGFVCSNGKSFRVLDVASKWLTTTDYDAVLWTALPGNFQQEVGKEFSHEKGRDYLKTLNSQALEEAWRYIEYAPEVTDTPFRRFLSQDDFWQSLNFGIDQS